MAVANCRPRRRQGGARRAGAADRRGAARAAAPVRGARRVARRHIPHGRRHEHHARRPRHRARALPLGVRHDGRRRQQRPRHRARRAARHPSERRARVRLARPRRANACSCRAPAPVGHDLARDCSRPTARDVLVSDVDEGRAAARRRDRRRRGDALATECDVYSPCAVGGTLNADTIPQLRCRIVAGSANNQLARAGGRGAPARARDPLRARLRDQRGRRDPAGRARGQRLGRATSSSATSPRSATRCADLPRRGRSGITPAAAAERWPRSGSRRSALTRSRSMEHVNGSPPACGLTDRNRRERATAPDRGAVALVIADGARRADVLLTRRWHVRPSAATAIPSLEHHEYVAPRGCSGPCKESRSPSA